MSYSIGQFRRTQLTSYSTNLSFEMSTQENESSITSSDIVFYDACIQLEGSNILNSQNSYYLKFKINMRGDSAQTFNIKLRNSESTEDNYQTIKSYNVAQGTGYTIFELVISPNATYNQVIFELSRIVLDYTTENEDGTYGRIISAEVLEFYSIYNVISYLSSNYSGLTRLTKIGIQGPPGLIMCINGEEIRIGKSGIYEINNGITIHNIGFIVKESDFTQDGLDYFIMDFQY